MDTETRAEQLFAEMQRCTMRRADRLFVVLMLVQWLGGIAAALIISPRSWAGTFSEPHIHVRAAVFLGGAITLMPVALALLAPGRVLTRHVIAFGQMLTSALLIHLTGGRIETHFHVFGSLAFLAFYRDWRVLVTGTVVVALDHFLRGAYYPQSVFGIASASSWRWLEHAGWVLFEDTVLVITCVASVGEMRRLAANQAALEATKVSIEDRVRERTSQLAASEARVRAYVTRLERVNREMVSRKEELEKLNRALQEARRAAEGASHAKSAFLANMSHEIRTPMTAILGFSDLLIDPQVDSSDRLNAAHIIQRNGRHLLELINDILDLSKIEAGRMEVERSECNPVTVVNEVTTLLSDRASEKNLYLRTELATEIPRVIRSDAVRLKQALVNLVGNAIKFTETGGVVIRLAYDASRQQLAVHVVDTGCGMTEAQVARVFHPFTQADASTTRRFGGTGLGLAISKSLTKLLGGDLTARSLPGLGSTFSMTIAAGPLPTTEWTRTIPSPSAPEGASPAPNAASRLSGRILLVEDGPDNQRLISFLLRKAGAVVELADNGDEGVRAALAAQDAGRPFGLIFMDMQMPVMDGYTATRTLRERGYTKPIVALTAHAMKGEVEKCLAAGCDAYLSKPVNRERLIATAEDYLRGVTHGVPETRETVTLPTP